jgi:Sec-independent protein translocase protein TatA
VNFLNVGPMELMVILIIAILVVGPKRLVETVQTIRRYAGQLRSLSSEFTTLIQTEVQAAQSGGDPASTDAAGSPEAGQDVEPGTGGDLKDLIREGIAPIASIQAELRATAQETREAFESVVTKDLAPIANIPSELQTELEQDLASIASIPAELQTELEDAAQETHRALATPIDSEPDKKEPTETPPSSQSKQEVG